MTDLDEEESDWDVLTHCTVRPILLIAAHTPYILFNLPHPGFVYRICKSYNQYAMHFPSPASTFYAPQSVPRCSWDLATRY